MAKSVSKTSPKRKRKYTVLLIVVLICSFYVGFKAMQASEDIKTRAAAMSMSNPIGKYINTHQRVPNSLDEAGISSVPDTITYQKIDNQRFKICAVFRRANDPTVSKLKLFTNLIYINDSKLIQDEIYKSPYYGAVSVDDSHLAGPDCYSIHYYTFWPKPGTVQ